MEHSRTEFPLYNKVDIASFEIVGLLFIFAPIYWLIVSGWGDCVLRLKTSSVSGENEQAIRLKTSRLSGQIEQVIR